MVEVGEGGRGFRKERQLNSGGVGYIESEYGKDGRNYGR